MSIVEKRQQAVRRNLQLLRSMGALTESEESAMLKKYNIKDKETLEKERRALTRFMKADELRVKKMRPKPRKRPRCLFSRPLSDSDDSDWASSGDEWQPESSPVSGLKAFPKRGVSKCPPKNNCQSSKSVAPKEINRLSVDSKTSSRGPLQSVDASGALMELQDEGRNFPKRNIAKLNYKEPPPDPEDDRYLYCYECDKLYEDPCPTHPIMWIRSVRPLNCDAVKSGNARDCCCGSDERNHAKRTAPEAFVTVGRSSIKGAGLGVWAEKTIPIGSVFGPYGGEVVPLDGLSEEEFKRVVNFRVIFFHTDTS
uniref:SET domain-containing protein n=1 Tax=Mesocestoides corti TaxID=53468 RepID=A0A5K3FM53_MESCO